MSEESEIVSQTLDSSSETIDLRFRQERDGHSCEWNFSWWTYTKIGWQTDQTGKWSITQASGVIMRSVNESHWKVIRW